MCIHKCLRKTGPSECPLLFMDLQVVLVVEGETVPLEDQNDQKYIFCMSLEEIPSI